MNPQWCRKLSIISREGSSERKMFWVEFNALIKNHIWDLIHRPKGCKIIISKWILKHKKNEIARIVRLKTRLMIREFSQIYEIDYLNIYASMIKLTSIRILLAITVIYELKIHQMNIVTAFLTGELKEEIFMKQSEEFEVGIMKNDLICRFRRSFYDLKQTSWIWNQRIRLFLKSIEFDQTYSDPYIYINKKTRIIIAMWMNDLIIFGKDMININDLKI